MTDIKRPTLQVVDARSEAYLFLKSKRLNIPEMMRRSSRQGRYGPYPPETRRNRNWDDNFTRGYPYQMPRSHPAKMSWLDGKVKAAPTDKDFEILHSTTIQPVSRSLELSPEEAFTLAEQALSGHMRKQIDCMRNAHIRMASAEKRLLPFQVFNELDREYFRSMLKGNVSLGWSNLTPGILSQIRRAGHTGNPRTRIELSPLLHQHGRRHDIFAALIHQMIHAYYLQCCGHRDRGHSGNGHDLGHDQPFRALLRCVGEHCEPLRYILSVDLWAPYKGHHLRPVDQYRFGESSCDPSTGTSLCYAGGYHYNEVDIQDWRDVALAKTKSLQEARASNGTIERADERTIPRNVYCINKDGIEEPPNSFNSWQYPHEASILVRFDDRHYLIPQHSVADLAALTSSPHFKDKSVLSLPQGTTHEDFLTLYSFLVHGGYPPVLGELDKTSSPVEATSQGPPAIKAYDPNAPKKLVLLIAAYHLGSKLRYKPLCDHAVRGLEALRSTAEDPIEVLEKIYFTPNALQGSTTPAVGTSTTSLYSHLGEWVVRWLQVLLPEADWGQYGATCKTNLGVIRYHPKWSERFRQLKARSSTLGEIERIADIQLSLKYYDNTELRKDLGSPEVKYFNPAQAYHTPQIFFQPNTVEKPGQSRDNTPILHGGNPNPFDMTSLWNGLPMEYNQGLCNQPQRIPTSVVRPDQWQIAEFLRREQKKIQEQALRAVSNSEFALYHQMYPDWYQSAIEQNRPGAS
ncbi:MAG: hypothetical protein Q9166_006357 [cf. Caloplaca sp. 2 TL-2023]